jgi:hypothetical protein
MSFRDLNEIVTSGGKIDLAALRELGEIARTASSPYGAGYYSAVGSVALPPPDLPPGPTADLGIWTQDGPTPVTDGTVFTPPTSATIHYILGVSQLVTHQGTLTAGSSTVTGLDTTAGLQTGWFVYGPGVSGSVFSIDSSSALTLSQAASGSGTVTLYFTPGPIAAAVAAVGSLTAGSPVVNSLSSTAGIAAGMYVGGTGLNRSPGNYAVTTVLSVDSPTQITLSYPAFETLSGVALGFFWPVQRVLGLAPGGTEGQLAILWNVGSWPIQLVHSSRAAPLRQGFFSPGAFAGPGGPFGTTTYTYTWPDNGVVLAQDEYVLLVWHDFTGSSDGRSGQWITYNTGYFHGTGTYPAWNLCGVLLGSAGFETPGLVRAGEQWLGSGPKYVDAIGINTRWHDGASLGLGAFAAPHGTVTPGLNGADPAGLVWTVGLDVDGGGAAMYLNGGINGGGGLLAGRANFSGSVGIMDRTGQVQTALDWPAGSPPAIPRAQLFFSASRGPGNGALFWLTITTADPIVFTGAAQFWLTRQTYVDGHTQSDTANFGLSSNTIAPGSGIGSAYWCDGKKGLTGSFTTGDGHVVTITGGIITNVQPP